jgi:hypothetical protein
MMLSSMDSSSVEIFKFCCFAFLCVPGCEVFAPLIWILCSFDYYLFYYSDTDCFID